MKKKRETKPEEMFYKEEIFYETYGQTVCGHWYNGQHKWPSEEIARNIVNHDKALGRDAFIVKVVVKRELVE